MPQTPDTYTSAVCTCLRHATAKEKAAVRAELAAHIDDHAAALLEAGYDADHAQQQAVAAMGDPQEMGAVLNREFPLRWLVLSRLALVLLVVAALSVFRFVPGSVIGAAYSLQARVAPTSSSYYENHPATNFVPLDRKETLSNGTVLSVYGVGLEPLDGVHYNATVYAVIYHPNPFRAPLLPTLPTSTVTETGEELLLFSSGTQHPGACYYSFLAGPTANQDITLHYNGLGDTFDIPLDLPWEEVLP